MNNKTTYITMIMHIIIITECKEGQFYSFPFGQTVALKNVLLWKSFSQA